MKRLLLFLSLCFICTAAIAHTINWYVDGNVYHTTTCESGENVTPPIAPEKYGYTFKGWILYTNIEYLESTGTQWIDTGLIFDQDTSIKIKVNLNDVTVNQYGYVFGAGDSAQTNSFEMYTWNSAIDFNYNGNNSSEEISSGDTVVVDWDKNKIKYSKNEGPYVQITTSYVPFSTPYTVSMFAIHRPNGIRGTSQIKIYYFKVYDKGYLIRDFIPVLDTDGVPCMYDLVEHKFYYNAGTGDFIAGPIVDK